MNKIYINKEEMINDLASERQEALKALYLTNKDLKDTKKGEPVIYNGEIIRNIGNYLVQKGYYFVRIDGQHENVKSSIYFWIKII